jgi:hypothetical protein
MEYPSNEDSFALRLTDEERPALSLAAANDKREIAAMARLILTEWLIAKGYLQQESRR